LLEAAGAEVMIRVLVVSVVAVVTMVIGVTVVMRVPMVIMNVVAVIMAVMISAQVVIMSVVVAMISAVVYDERSGGDDEFNGDMSCDDGNDLCVVVMVVMKSDDGGE
jgi:hypothetical protein